MTQRGGILLRGKIWHFRYNHHGHERQESSHSTRRSDAVKLRTQRLADLARGLQDPATVQRYRLGTHLDRLEAQYLQKSGRAPAQYRAHLMSVRTALGHAQVVALTPTTCSASSRGSRRGAWRMRRLTGA